MMGLKLIYKRKEARRIGDGSNGKYSVDFLPVMPKRPLMIKKEMIG